MKLLEVYDRYENLGIKARPLTTGKELDMVYAFIKHKESTYKTTENRNLAVFLETKINNSYPDVLFVEYDPRKYDTWNTKRGLLQVADYKVFHYIYTHKNADSPRIIKELSISYKQLLQSLEALLDAELIIRNTGKWYIRDRENVFGAIKIQAVEAKINKWKEAMQQAIVNQTFASESYVLSNASNSPSSSTVQQIKSLGIGIYIYNNDAFRKLNPAKKRNFPINYNSIIINDYIGRILNS